MHADKSAKAVRNSEFCFARIITKKTFIELARVTHYWIHVKTTRLSQFAEKLLFLFARTGNNRICNPSPKQIPSWFALDCVLDGDEDLPTRRRWACRKAVCLDPRHQHRRRIIGGQNSSHYDGCQYAADDAGSCGDPKVAEYAS
jgi:hypothetical protein